MKGVSNHKCDSPIPDMARLTVTDVQGAPGISYGELSGNSSTTSQLLPGRSTYLDLISRNIRQLFNY